MTKIPFIYFMTRIIFLNFLTKNTIVICILELGISNTYLMKGYHVKMVFKKIKNKKKLMKYALKKCVSPVQKEWYTLHQCVSHSLISIYLIFLQFFWIFMDTHFLKCVLVIHRFKMHIRLVFLVKIFKNGICVIKSKKEIFLAITYPVATYCWILLYYIMLLLVHCV